MKDIQSQHDSRRINIKKVGVKDINYPITVLDRANQVQHTVAKVNMYVNLPHRFKGTHMSRFIEILNRVHGKITVKSFHTILQQMKERLQAESAHLEIEFPYFLKKGGESGLVNTREYSCAMHGSLNESEQLTVTVHVPIQPPLPQQGNRMLPRSLGHWGMATVSVRYRQFLWIEDLITIIEEITSHRLNWPDHGEAAATCLSVEQTTAAIGERLRSHPDIKWFSVQVENLSEGHSTFAILEWPESGES